MSDMPLERANDLVLKEVNRSVELHNGFNSTHEGYAVILEELDELWQLVKENRYLDEAVLDAMIKEAVQVSATATVFILQCMMWRDRVREGGADE